MPKMEPNPTVPTMNGRAIGITSQAMSTNPSETIAPARVPGTDKFPKELGEAERGFSGLGGDKNHLPIGAPVSATFLKIVADYLPLLRPERQQHISGNASVARIAGCNKHHAARDYGARAVHGTAVALHPIHRFEIAHGIEIPQRFAVLDGVARECARRLKSRIPRREFPSPRRAGRDCIPGRAFRTRRGRNVPFLAAVGNAQGREASALFGSRARRRGSVGSVCGKRFTSDTVAKTFWPSVAMPHCTPPFVPPLPTRVCQTTSPFFAGSSAQTMPDFCPASRSSRPSGAA